MLEWVLNEFKTLKLDSHQLVKSFKSFISRLAEAPDLSILAASGGRAKAKAGYRLLTNETLSLTEIHRSHLDAVNERINEARGNEPRVTILAVQDTSCVNYGNRKKTKNMGYSSNNTLGINVHSCIAVTTDGLPIGLLAQSYSTRTEAKDTRSHHEKRTRPIEEKESNRWLETMNITSNSVCEQVDLIHITDREGDIYDLYSLAVSTDQRFIIRAAYDRINMAGEHILSLVRSCRDSGIVKIQVPANSRTKTKKRVADLTVRFISADVKKPQIQKDNAMLPESLQLTLVCLREDNPPAGVDPLEWILMTNLQVKSFDDAANIAELYQLRWKIERFHYVLKSGCTIEQIQQRSAEGIEMMILFYSYIAIQIMLLTYSGRCMPNMSCELLFSDEEWKLLYRAAHRTKRDPDSPYSLQQAVLYVAKLGGFAGAPSDGHPGLKSIWNGMRTLNTLHSYREIFD